MSEKPEALRNALEKAFRMGAAFSRSDVELGHMIQADFAAHVIEQCAEVEALRADAVRYLWIKSRAKEEGRDGGWIGMFVLYPIPGWDDTPYADQRGQAFNFKGDFDAAVDAAMAKEQTK